VAALALRAHFAQRPCHQSEQYPRAIMFGEQNEKNEQNEIRIRLRAALSTSAKPVARAKPVAFEKLGVFEKNTRFLQGPSGVFGKTRRFFIGVRRKSIGHSSNFTAN